MKRFKMIGKFDLWSIPLLLAIIIPLIVKMIPYELSLDEVSLYGYETYTDIFGLMKAKIFVLLTILSLVLFLKDLHLKKRKIIENKVNYFLFVYGIFIVLSGVLSPHNQIALWGIVDRYEGMYVQLSYLMYSFLLIQYLGNCVKEEVVLKIICISTIIIGLISLGQYIGFNLLNWYPVRVLISNADIASRYKILAFNSEMAYGTLGNPNFLSGFSALVLPMFIYYYIQNNDLNRLTIAAICCSTISLVTSQSSAGILGAGLGIFIAIVVSNSIGNIDTKKIKALLLGNLIVISILIIVGNLSKEIILLTIVILCCSVLLVIFLNFKKKDDFLRKRKKVIWIIGILFVVVLGSVLIPQLKKEEFIKYIVIEDQTLLIDTAEGVTKLQITDGELEVQDFNDNVIEYTLNGNLIESSNDTLNLLEIIMESNEHNTDIMIKRMGMEFRFKNESITYINQFGNPVNLVNTKRFGFVNLGHLFSCRGYLWSTSIPLLKDNFIVGSGPDTFVFEYPQYDIKGKFNMFGTPHILIDKPHNIFLQIGIQNGVIALFIFVGIIIYLFKAAYELLPKLKKRSYLWGYLAGISAYLVTALFYDSSVGVSIMFWTVFSCAVSELDNDSVKLM